MGKEHHDLKCDMQKHIIKINDELRSLNKLDNERISTIITAMQKLDAKIKIEKLAYLVLKDFSSTTPYILTDSRQFRLALFVTEKIDLNQLFDFSETIQHIAERINKGDDAEEIENYMKSVALNHYEKIMEEVISILFSLTGNTFSHKVIEINNIYKPFDPEFKPIVTFQIELQ